MTLAQLQSLIKRWRQKKVCCIKLATQQDLTNVIEPLLMPPFADCILMITHPESPEARQMIARDYFVVPQDAEKYGVSGACFTGPRQMGWIRQLQQMPGGFVLHMDAKYKLHHGQWALIVIGTHVPRQVRQVSLFKPV